MRLQYSSPNQIKECTIKLTQWAKANNVAIILVGHITKTGDISGPKVFFYNYSNLFFLKK